jgi:hypothetical protein
VSVNVRELLDSRAIAKKGGKLTATRSFHVFNTATPLTSPATIATLFGTNGMPIYGEEFPESPNLLARDYEYALVSGHNDLWLVRWDYAEQEFGGTLPEKEPGQPGYVEISASISAERVNAWRSLSYSELTALTGSSGPYANGNSATKPDIGGDRIDVAGDPLQDVVRQVEITITEVRTGIPNLLFLLPYTWARNSTRFLNAPVGQLLYVGANINRIDINLFQFSHKFILDRWWHMRQMAVTDRTGNVITKPYGTPQIWRAETVQYVQGFPTLRDFFQMSPNFRGNA